MNNRRINNIMKYSWCIGFVLLACYSVSGQNFDFDANVPMKIIAESSDQGIKLRWAPKSYSIWQEGIILGYTLERYTEMVLGDSLSIDDIQASKVTLLSSGKPLPEADWSSFTDNNNADIAKATIYFDQSGLEDDPNLATILEDAQDNESRHVFSLYAAEQDFEVAEAMAVGYHDTSVDIGSKYFYQLTIDSTSYLTALSLEHTGLQDLPQIENLTGIGGDKEVILEWNSEVYEDYYTHYNVERSTDNLTFDKVNDLPFVFLSQDGNDLDYSYYRDSIPTVGDVYYYRLIGHTIFGSSGPPSTPIAVQSQVPRQNLSLLLNVDTTTASTATISWVVEYLDGVNESPLGDYKIYNSLTAGSGYTLINSIGNASPPIDITDLPLESYIKIEGTDAHGHIYESVSKLVQLIDEDPPVVPTGLQAEFISSDMIEMTWNANNEPDLSGYQIFQSYGDKDLLSRVNNLTISENTYSFQVNTEFLVDSIFLCVSARDLRGNTSEKSQPIVVALPDNVPPPKPNIFKIYTTQGGIVLDWQLSISDDLSRHILERKRSGAPGWEEIHTILPSDTIATDSLEGSFIDDAQLEQRPYDYRLVAYDDSDNYSSSSIVSATPYASPIAGDITNLQLDSVGMSEPANQPHPEAYDIITYAIETYETDQTFDVDTLMALVPYSVITGEEYNQLAIVPVEDAVQFLRERKVTFWDSFKLVTANLSWAYEDTEHLLYFEIYRNEGNAALELYKTIHISEMDDFTYVDADVSVGTNYTYMITALHSGGAESNVSDALFVRIP